LNGEEQKLHAAVLLISVGARLARDDGLTGDLSFLGVLAIKLNVKKKPPVSMAFLHFLNQS
jgi:hypothetical protein